MIYTLIRNNKEIVPIEKITSIYFDSKQRYGSPRIAAEFTSLGIKLSRITVAKYM
jgi:putative transposase